MNIQYPKTTPRLICEEISKLTSTDIKLTKRPWDRFRPDISSWWLVPSTDLPHYKYAKLYFTFEDSMQETINYGLYIEKGLDEGLKELYSSRQGKYLIMNSSWAWHKIVRAFNDSSLFEALPKIGNKLPPVKIAIEGGYITEPSSFDPYQDKKIKWDKYSFEVSSNSDEIVLKNSNRSSFTLKLHAVKTKQGLVSAINDLNKDQWLWLNIFIYTEAPAITNSTIANLAGEGYECFLKPLLPFLCP